MIILQPHHARLVSSAIRRCDEIADEMRSVERRATSANFTIGEELRRVRNESDLSLREVARRMVLSPSHLSNLEKGYRRWDRSLIARFREAVGKHWIKGQ